MSHWKEKSNCSIKKQINIFLEKRFGDKISKLIYLELLPVAVLFCIRTLFKCRQRRMRALKGHAVNCFTNPGASLTNFIILSFSEVAKNFKKNALKSFSIHHNDKTF